MLDGTIPTLDASELSYEFEKARIRGYTDDDVDENYYRTDNAVMPPTFEYVSSFRDNATGTSGVAFKDTTTGKVIIAYTGTNLDSDGFNDAFMTDGVSIALGTGHHYDSAYQFYEKVLKENGLNPEDIILTGHSLGGNIAQRVALKYNAPKTIVYNPAPLYVPVGALLSSLLTNPLLEITIEKNASDDSTITPSKMLTFYKKGYKYKWDIQQNVRGRKIQYVELKPQKANTEVKQILLGIDIQTKHIYNLIEIGKNGTRTTITVNTFKTNQPLSDNIFKFDREKYKKDGYTISEL